MCLEKKSASLATCDGRTPSRFNANLEDSIKACRTPSGTSSLMEPTIPQASCGRALSRHLSNSFCGTGLRCLEMARHILPGSAKGDNDATIKVPMRFSTFTKSLYRAATKNYRRKTGDRQDTDIYFNPAFAE